MPTDQDPNSRDHFNRWSHSYEHSPLQWLLFGPVHRGLLKRIPAAFIPTAVLDIGCGTGRLLRRMAARWPAARLAGIDVADGMLAEAHQITPAATFYLAPAEHIPFPDASIDLVTSSTSFHHWTDQAMGVHEAARILRHGGLFVLADMSLASHGRPLSPAQVRVMFTQAGLSIRSQTTPVPFYTFTVGER